MPDATLASWRARHTDRTWRGYTTAPASAEGGWHSLAGPLAILDVVWTRRCVPAWAKDARQVDRGRRHQLRRAEECNCLVRSERDACGLRGAICEMPVTVRGAVFPAGFELLGNAPAYASTIDAGKQSSRYICLCVGMDMVHLRRTQRAPCQYRPRLHRAAVRQSHLCVSGLYCDSAPLSDNGTIFRCAAQRITQPVRQLHCPEFASRVSDPKRFWRAPNLRRTH
ncbi:hypothetical protein P3T25_009118 [Paraburkholderia sp. GAS32]